MKKMIIASLVLAACSDTPNANPEELITTVRLTFTPSGGGTAIVAEFDDPDGDGGDAPTVDPVNLAPGSYALAVAFENGLEDPPEDITAEVADEAADHLVLFEGPAPLAYTYGDQDPNGLPIGLAGTVVATMGSGNFIVTLRHMPPELPPVKDATTVETARTQGLDAIGGATDARVTFFATVVP